MNTDQKIQELEKKVAELSKWKDERTKQQITYPLDFESIKTLGKYFLRIIGSFILVGGVAGREFKYFFVQQDLMIASIGEDKSVRFTAATDDTITLVSGFSPIHTFADDDRVYVSTSDTLPSPLSSTTTYYVISSAGTTFKLSTSSGGAAVNITDTGTGTHYINYL